MALKPFNYGLWSC